MSGQSLLSSIIESLLARQRIINEIKAYIDQFRVPYWQWYVGITSDPIARLFQEHRVSQQGYSIWRPTPSHEDARAVEEHFINEVRTAGGGGGGDSLSTYVYAYLKNISTNP